MKRALGWPLVLAALTGCSTESTTILTNGALVEAEAIGVEVHTEPAFGTVVVRAVDDLGLAVGPGQARVDVDSAFQDVPVDPFGYGELTLDAEVTAVEGRTAIRLPGVTPLPDLPRLESVRAPAISIVSARRGYLVNTGDQVWWSGPDLPDHPVLDLGEPVRGLASVQVDGDGVADGVAWAGSRVVLLRGRPEGGAAFGARIEADGWTALAAAVGDLDEDGDGDLAIAWDTGEGAVLQAWLGDGAWGFEPTDEIGLLDGPADLDISRARSDASVVLTALVTGAAWVRYRITDSVWVGTGGQVSVTPAAGSRLDHADLNGDGRDELILASPRLEDADRRIDVWDLQGENPTVLPLDVPGGRYTLGDADGDGVSELWLLAQDGLLQILRSEEGRYISDDAGLLEPAGPIGVTLLEGDTVPDLLVGVGDAWQRFRGRLDEGDGRWRPVRPLATRRELELVSAMVPVDAEPDLDEIAGISAVGEWRAVRRLALEASGPVARDDVRLRRDAAEVVDLAGCGADLWVLFEDEVVHVDLVAGVVVGRSEVAGGQAVTCQHGGDVRAAVLTSAQVLVLGPGAASEGSLDATGDDVMLIDGAPVACASACAAWAWPDGSDAQVRAIEGGVEVEWPGGTTIVPAGQHLAVQDSDRDGTPELWIRDPSGRIGVVRATSAGPAVEAWLWTSPRYQGPPWVLEDPARGLAVWFSDDTSLVWTP